MLSTFAYEAAGALRASGFPCALYLEGIHSNLGRHRVARSRFAVLGCLTREQDGRPIIGHGIVPGPAVDAGTDSREESGCSQKTINLIQPREIDFEIVAGHGRVTRSLPDRFKGDVSGIRIIAPSPAAVATSRYHEGASAFPVTSVSHATTSCAVPPKIAIATA
jgi:hypothetical protein